MAPSPLQQRRTHNALLFQKLLNLRDGASPFTLVLDTLEQRDGPLVKEFARRAKLSKSKLIFLSSSTLRKKLAFDVDIFISTAGKSLSTLRSEILSHFPSPPTPSIASQKSLLVIDTLNPLSSSPTTSLHLSTFLSSLLTSPAISLLATYHLDTPLPSPSSHSTQFNQYNPDPLTTLTYFATAILRTSNLSHAIARKRARDKSLQEPEFGLGEGREGVIVGLGGEKVEGVVVEMEIRRKSGRGVMETFVLTPLSSSQPASNSTIKSSNTLNNIILLDEHPLYSSTPSGFSRSGEYDAEGKEVETTFNLGLTEKQKRDREGVVLPYFDAQKEGGALGAGEGGRILYEMGAEDREDFDDEEDEI